MLKWRPPFTRTFCCQFDPPVIPQSAGYSPNPDLYYQKNEYDQLDLVDIEIGNGCKQVGTRRRGPSPTAS